VAGRLREERARRSRSTALSWVGTVAAAAAAAAAILLAVGRTRPPERGVVPIPPRPERVTVRKLEPKPGAAVVQRLVDGSRIEVAGGSRVKVTAWPDRQRPLVELLAGQVTCEVAKGKGEFKVRTPAGEAVALGTKFTVRLDLRAEAETGDGGEKDVKGKTLVAMVMTVAVISGEVLVRDLTGAGQLAVAGETVKVGEDKVPAQVAEKWSSGSLVPRLADGSQGQPLEVRKHSATVTIKEQIALVEVDQTFYNDTNQRLEGVFYFPLPAGATICRLAMYVGDRLMEGEIAETRRARRTFEALLVQNLDPALLEWAGGNMFKMRVFPIEAKSEKRVLISYYQVLKREHGRIRFTYPLVSDALQTHPVGEVDVKVSVSTTPKIVDAAVPTYKEAEVTAEAHTITASLTAKKTSPQRDFVLEYRVAKGEGELVVVPYWHERDGEGYFLMIFSPELEEADSDKQVSSRFVFVVDKSGGLGDRHLALARKAVEHALGLLKPGDEFGIVAYDAFAQNFKPDLVKASPENRAAASKWLAGLTSMGASDLSAAWTAAAKLAGAKGTQIVYVGSGLSTLTSTRTAKLVAEAEKALKGTDVRLHCLSLGDVQDSAFLAELARKFDGTVRPLASADDVQLHVGELMDDYAWPLYTDVRMEFLRVETSEIYPVWFPNVSAGRQLFAFGKYNRQGKAAVRLKAGYKDRPYDKEFEVNLDGRKSNNFVARLWANEKIRHLQDVAALAEANKAGDMIQTVIATSKRYRVMSQYTSFIVLETAEDYERYGIERRADEFGDTDGEADAISDVPMGGQGGGADKANYWKSGRLRDREKPGGPRAKHARNGAPAKKMAEEQDRGALRRMVKGDAAEAKEPGAPPMEKAAATRPTSAGKELRKRRAKDELGHFESDVLSWARQDIFPVFASNELPKWYYKHTHSPAEAMKVLKDLGARFRSLSMKFAVYRLEKDGEEKLEGREWEVAVDVAARRFFSRKLGDDHFDVSDGKELVRFFPLLKYAAKRKVSGADLMALVSHLPGYLFPWAEKLDYSWYATVRKGDEGVVIRLQRRGQKHTYILIHLKGEKGPVVKIQEYRQQWHRTRKYYARLVRTIECTEFKKVGGVEVPVVMKSTYHIAGREVVNAREMEMVKKMLEKMRGTGNAAKAEELAKRLAALQATAKGTVRIVRVKDVKVNYKPKAEEFEVKLPKDWAVRDLDASPRGKDVKSTSRPVNASNLVR
jgi:hypothetical protein